MWIKDYTSIDVMVSLMMILDFSAVLMAVTICHKEMLATFMKAHASMPVVVDPIEYVFNRTRGYDA